MSVKSSFQRAAKLNRQKAPPPRAMINQLYKELFAASPDGILLIDAETQRVVEFNDQAARQLGYTREEFAGLRISDFDTSQTPEEIAAHVQQAVRDGQAEFETVQRTKSGDNMPVHVWAKTVDLDGRLLFHTIFRDITEGTKAADAMRMSEQSLAQAQRIAHLGSWNLDLETNTLTWSDELYRIYGVSPDVFIPSVDTFLSLIHVDDRSAMRSWIDALLSGMKPGPLQFRVVRPDGTRVIEGDGEVHVNAENRPIRMVGTGQDITDRKLKEKELANILQVAKGRAQRLALLESNLPLVLWEAAVQGDAFETTWVSPNVEGILGMRAEEFVGTSAWISHVHPDDLSSLHVPTPPAPGAAAPTAWVDRYRWIRPDGTVIHLQAGTSTAGTNDGDGSRSLVGFVLDVTKDSQAQETLQFRTRLLQEAQKIAHLGSWVVDLDTGKNTWSDELYRIYGVSPDACVASVDSLLALVHPDDRPAMRSWVSAGPFTKGPTVHQFRVVRPDGTICVIEGNAEVEFNAEHRPIRLIGTAQDITERIRKDEALALFRALIDQSSDAIEVIDPGTGRYLDVNERACQDLGYSREELLALNVRDVDPTLDEASFARAVAELQTSGGLVWDGIHRRKDGSSFPAEVNIKHVGGERDYLVAAVRDVTERKRAEATLKQNDARYRALTQFVPFAMITSDAAGNITDWNLAAEAIFGYTAAEAIGQPETMLIPHRYRERHLSGVTRVRSGGAPRIIGKIMELEGLRKDQSEFPLDLSLSRWQVNDNWFVTACISDATERRRALRALQASEKLLNDSLAVAELGSYALDLSTGRWTSSAILDGIFGIDDQHERSIEGWKQIIDPDWQDRMGRYLTEEVIGKRRLFDMEYPIRRKHDGHARWVHGLGKLEFDAEGKPSTLIGTISDVSERRQIETAIRLQAAALHAAADAIVITDRAGVIEWVNPAFSQLTGYTAEEALGKNPRDLVKSGTQPPAFYRELWETILAGRTWHGEMVNRRKDGSRYTEDESVTPILDASGAITHFVAIKADMTEHLKLEAQYRQAQKMEGVGQLASGIAHDFNNLLTVINGMADLALNQIGQDDPVRADVQEIARAGERAAGLTRQLLAFSRQQILAPRVLNVNTVVAGSEDLLRRLLGEDIDLVVVLAPALASVRADSGQIEQVITNLAVNARDAMPQGGRLTIETQTVTIDETRARSHGEGVAPGPYVRLAVSDSGGGMDEATRARIFEPFFTTKGPGKGTGLGLATVWGIVTQSHGFVSVYSEVGRGTSVQIFLPQVAEAEDLGTAERTMAPGSGTETILIAEDNSGLRKLATRFLEPAGYTVLGAATGEEALELLAQHEAPVHLLLSDVVMPGMSGRLLAEQVAQTHPGMKVLYMSGYTSDTVVRHGVLDATMPFLNKPFTAVALLGKVREVLDS